MAAAGTCEHMYMCVHMCTCVRALCMCAHCAYLPVSEKSFRLYQIQNSAHGTRVQFNFSIFYAFLIMVIPK